MSDDPFLQSLLEAGRSELPDPARIEALAQKLGPLAAAGGGGAAVAAKASLWSSGLVKGGVALAVAASVGGAAALVGVPDAATMAPPPVYTASMPAAPPPAQPAVEAAAGAPSAAAVPSTPRSPAPGAVQSAPASEDPEEEARLLHRAQDALHAAPAEALKRSQEHARKFPHGLLAQEREVLAIDALLRLGRSAEAQKRADAFTRAYPGSSHRRRIEALLSGR